MNTDKGKNAKDVIYVDVEEEITGVIDNVRASDHRIVALVLPKRAAVFQSIVNMKLLKRAADETKKNVVLITSEAGLRPLAGSVGLFVAKNLNSKPEIPDAPASAAIAKDDADEAVEELEEESLDKTKTVGELNGDEKDEEETIELDDIDEENPAEAPVGAVAQSKKKSGRKDGKGKRFSIPNFKRFRLIMMIAGAGVVLLVVLLVLGLVVLPKAQVSIKTNSQALTISQDVTLKVGNTITLDVDKAVLPAQKQEVQKEVTEQAAATGQVNNGEKATGSITMTAKNCSTLATPTAVPAGTGVTANGQTYITQERANFGGGTFDGTCLNFKANNVKIAAQSAGAQSNVNSGTFTVLGRSDVSASGSASGGTDNIVKVISQADIDSAKRKIGAQDAEAVKRELTAALQTKGLRPIESTFAVGTAEGRQSANAGDQAETVSVTQKVTYSMLGVTNDDVEKIIQNSVQDKIDTQKQNIIDYGLNEATFTMLTAQSDGAVVNLHATAVAGPELDVDEIKKQVAGKKAASAKEIIMANPGVTDVTVKYSPFWVSSIPGKTSKITVVVEEPQQVNNKQDAQQQSD